MATYDRVHDDDSFTTIWSNDDVPSIQQILDMPAGCEFDCPADGCGNAYPIRVDDPDDLDKMIDDIEGQGGTIRCGKCDIPMYAIRNDGDHDDSFGSMYFDTGVLYQ